MTNEQLVLFIQQGDADDLIPVLWERTRKIVFKQANVIYAQSKDDFISHGYELSDFTHECYPAFLQAIKSYTAESGYSFLAFLRYPIMQVRERLLYRRRIPNPLDGAVSLNVPTSDDTDAAELLDFIEDSDPTPEQRAEKRTLSATINTAIERLAEKETVIIRSYFYDNETLAETAKRLHISRQRAAQIKDHALKKLRNDPDIIQLYDMLFKS